MVRTGRRAVLRAATRRERHSEAKQQHGAGRAVQCSTHTYWTALTVRRLPWTVDRQTVAMDTRSFRVAARFVDHVSLVGLGFGTW